MNANGNIDIDFLLKNLAECNCMHLAKQHANNTDYVIAYFNADPIMHLKIDSHLTFDLFVNFAWRKNILLVGPSRIELSVSDISQLRESIK